MVQVVRNIYNYRELLLTLAWKEIMVRYKQAYLGVVWTVLKPVMLMLIFTLVRSFVGIDSGDIPYPILTFAALLPWTFFQESTSQGVGSVVQNAMLVKKIYFPREIFPLAAVLTKLMELGINFFILAGLMIFYQMAPTANMLWVLPILLYTIIVSLTISLAGAAMNVYYRDISSLLPVILSLLMYLSPVIYPLSLVKKTLLVNQSAGEWSDIFYNLYLLNPLVGIIEGFQKSLLQGVAPDFSAMLPGMILTLVLLPFSYNSFKKAESYFADVI